MVSLFCAFYYRTSYGGQSVFHNALAGSYSIKIYTSRKKYDQVGNWKQENMKPVPGLRKEIRFPSYPHPSSVPYR